MINNYQYSSTLFSKELPYQMLLTIFNIAGEGGEKDTPTSFSPVTSTNVAISPQDISDFYF